MRELGRPDDVAGDDALIPEPASLDGGSLVVAGQDGSPWMVDVERGTWQATNLRVQQAHPLRFLPDGRVAMLGASVLTVRSVDGTPDRVYRLPGPIARMVALGHGGADHRAASHRCRPRARLGDRHPGRRAVAPGCDAPSPGLGGRRLRRSLPAVAPRGATVIRLVLCIVVALLVAACAGSAPATSVSPAPVPLTSASPAMCAPTPTARRSANRSGHYWVLSSTDLRWSARATTSCSPRALAWPTVRTASRTRRIPGSASARSRSSSRRWRC